MRTCLKPDCNDLTATPVPFDHSGFVTASEMYCKYHLEHLNDEGEWNPIQVSIPVKD